MSSRWLILSINFSYLQSVEMLNETINVKKSREMFLFSALSKHLKTRKMRLLWGIELKEENNIYSSVTYLRESPKLMANFWGQYVVQVQLHWRFFLILSAGFLIDFISGPVSVGFTSAAAIIIATSQIKDLLGLNYSASRFVDVWDQLSHHIKDTSKGDAILGISCMVILLLLRVSS